MTTNKIIVITAPSGSGKSTLVKYLLESFEDKIDFFTSTTTRPIRWEEVHGREYYFITIQEMQDNIKSSKMIEYEEVYKDRYYGMTKDELQRIWNEDKTPIVDIDVKWAKNIKSLYPDTLSIFIAVSDISILEQRIKDRGTENPQDIKMRVDRAIEEFTHQDDFDYKVINDDLDTAKNTIYDIVRSYLEN